MNATISDLQSRLAYQSPDVARDLLPLAQVYRLLYYIESTSRILESRPDLTDRLLKTTVLWVEAFNHVERVSDNLSVRPKAAYV